MKVFLLGGTGAIGRPTLTALIDAGHEVTAVARSTDKAVAVEAEGAVAVEVSIFDRNELAEAMAGHDAVVNLATAMPPTWQFARLGAWRPTERIRREGSAAVVDAAVSAGVRRLLQESVVMLYQDQSSAWIDETSPVDHYPTAVGNHAAEASVRRFTAAGHVGIVLRFGLFYGPGARHSEQFLAFARRHVTPIIGNPDGYLSSIHVEDGGRAVAAALDAPTGIYNVVDDEPLTKRAYADALADAAHRASWIRGPGRVADLFGHRLTSLARSVRVSNRHLRDTVAWRPEYPDAAVGWHATAHSLGLNRG